MLKRLTSAFMGLPPELRLLVAMAGLGTPLGLVYVLQRAWKYLFGYTPSTFVLIIGLAVVVALLSLLGFLISKIWTFGAGKRRKKMESELAGGADTGPVSMDLRAAIRANNEKFFGAVRDMRRNAGISVYDLPWYIVIGDSGCGKTKLINEGGLVFSTGKPEGYQLGTLNYNWWFTEDAVFIDMAGRLCNPQDDADRREWMAFLDTIGRGRRGFPINGVLLCVSAEHLLQDSPEKQEQDANTALERLRDLQSKLGLTFATYLVVTKCDKILGFMQFFDRAGRDITVKNQIFGWSKPGTFNEPYDPEKFAGEFEAMYGRLNELRLRRLSDDAEEIELGLAYSFPEEFRELHEPLQTYVRTLFPMIKNPRAVKNLIFRGLYFTSATQVGGVILRHVTERLGPEAADQFPPLESLYPQPRPHFVKDLLAQKVIPEHGLVFRNERQVIRNRKLSRLLKVGSVALSVVLIGTLTWSVWAFGNLIGVPRENARSATAWRGAPNVALAGVQKLGNDVDRLVGRPWPARVLSLGVGADQPIRDLTAIQVSLFEAGVLRPALADVDGALRSTKLHDPRLGEKAVAAATACMDALEQYVAWYGCAEQPSPPEALNYEGFRTLCGVVPETEDFFREAGAYFTTIHGRAGPWGNPAGLLQQAGLDPPETIRAALLRVHDYLAGYATLTADHPDPVIREWMRIRDACSEIDKRYERMLQASQREVNTQQDLAEFKTQFVTAYDKFASAVDACSWRGGGTPVRIGALRDALLRQRAIWVDYQGRLEGALKKCGAEPPPGVAGMFACLTVGETSPTAVPGLDLILAKNLKDVALSDKGYMAGYFGEGFPKLVSEVYQRYAYILAFQSHKDSFDSDHLSITPQTRAVQAVLRGIRDRLAAARFEPAGDLSKETPSAWPPLLDRFLSQEAQGAKPTTTMPFGDLSEQWRPTELAALQAKCQVLIARGEGTRLLTTIAARLGQGGDWGFAALYPNWRDKTASAFQVPIPEVVGVPATEAPAETPSPPEKPAIRRPGERPAAIRRPGEASKPEASKPMAIELEGMIPASATHRFLNDLAWDYVRLKIYLEQFTNNYFLPGSGENKDLNKVCLARLDGAAQTFANAYAQAWGQAYVKKHLPLLERLIRERGSAWGALTQALSEKRSAADSDPRSIGRELQTALQEILEAVPWATYDVDRGWWKNQTDREWTDIEALVRVAIRNHWPEQYSKFVTEAQQPNPDVNVSIPPWAQVGQAFDRAWTNVVHGIVENGQLPREFRENTKVRTAIPWGEIESLRADARLKDEKLTGEFALFSRQAQSLLSAELTNVLCEVQGKYFPDQSPYDGWPFLNAGGERLTALETVPFKQFKDFLFEAGEAARVLAPLEKGLPDDDLLKQKREQFYRSCQLWRTFIGFNAQGVPADLKVDVRYVDPLDPTSPGGRVRGIDDTAQNYYGEVELYLGLAVQDPSQPGGMGSGVPLKISTSSAGEAGVRTAWWRWTAGGTDKTLKMQLAAGIQGEGKPKAYPDNIAPSLLGTSSPLGFCAYLHRYARYDDSNSVWVSTHAIDLAEAFKAVGAADLIPADGRTRIGAKFTFRLERPMPAPIRVLQRAAPTPDVEEKTPK